MKELSQLKYYTFIKYNEKHYYTCNVNFAKLVECITIDGDEMIYLPINTMVEVVN